MNCEVSWGDETPCPNEAYVQMCDLDGVVFNVCKKHRDYAKANPSENVWTVIGKPAQDWLSRWRGK